MKFNLTPVIDIVFLLIIFLIVVYQRIDAENFDVAVPDNCAFAQQKQTDSHRPITITAFADTNDAGVIFAVGAETLKKTAVTSPLIIDWLKTRINQNLQKSSLKTLCLRIDKNITYNDAKYILAAVAESQATGIELAAVKKQSF